MVEKIQKSTRERRWPAPLLLASVLAVWPGHLWGQAPGRTPIPNLKAAGPEQQVTKVAHCRYGATYTLTFADGATRPCAEINLRLKIDSTENGPPPGRAVLLRAGMVGDRASLVFGGVEELKTLLQAVC